MKKLQTDLECFYLRLRYLLFKKHIERKTWDDRTLVFTDNFDSLYNFEVRDREFYNDNPVWFSRDAVYLSDDGVHIRCYYDPKTHTSWQGTRNCTHTSGMITTRDSYAFSNGVWVVNAKSCESWCAIWLLKRDRLEPNFTHMQIKPEIDLLEILNSNHKVQHGIAYGYTDAQYNVKGIGSNNIAIAVIKCDNQFHEYAVELLSNGYKFYIDGILTTRFVSDEPDFVTNYPNYLLLNNASDQYTTKNTEFIVKSVKFYQ